MQHMLCYLVVKIVSIIGNVNIYLKAKSREQACDFTVLYWFFCANLRQTFLNFASSRYLMQHLLYEFVAKIVVIIGNASSYLKAKSPKKECDFVVSFWLFCAKLFYSFLNFASSRYLMQHLLYYLVAKIVVIIANASLYLKTKSPERAADLEMY